MADTTDLKSVGIYLMRVRLPSPLLCKFAIMTETEIQEEQEENFDKDHCHLADGPPYITTLCGVDVRGQLPNENSIKSECPICKALLNESYNIPSS